jgi:uncharacterized protein (DUF924 family)
VLSARSSAPRALCCLRLPASYPPLRGPRAQLVEPAEVLEYWFGPGVEAPDYKHRSARGAPVVRAAPSKNTRARAGELWWRGDQKVDDTIRQRFGDTLEAAAAGELDHWVSPWPPPRPVTTQSRPCTRVLCCRRTQAETPGGLVALLVLLDQFSRNMHRGTPRMFAFDAQALRLATDAVSAQRDAGMPVPWRLFVYIVLEHSESPTVVAWWASMHACVDAECRSALLTAGPWLRVCMHRGLNLMRKLLEQAPEPQKRAVDSMVTSVSRHLDILQRFGRYPHRNGTHAHRGRDRARGAQRSPTLTRRGARAPELGRGAQVHGDDLVPLHEGTPCVYLCP